MSNHRRALLVAYSLLAAQLPTDASVVAGQTRATVTEERRTLATYGFSEPNPVPILTQDTRLYPYHRFEGYAHDSEPREWTVLTLENEWVEVWVLPEVGGKVWGARVKATGHEFIYRNEVMLYQAQTKTQARSGHRVKELRCIIFTPIGFQCSTLEIHGV